MTQDSEDDLDAYDDEDADEEEFFDCRENLDDTSSLAKWSSMELTPMDEEAAEVKMRPSAATSRHKPPPIVTTNHDTGSVMLAHGSQSHHPANVRRVQSMRETSTAAAAQPSSLASSAGGVSACPTTVLILVAHGGSVLDLDMEVSVRKSDVTTFRGALESVMRTHYPGLVGHVVVKCIPCPSICSEALAVLSSLSPYR